MRAINHLTKYFLSNKGNRDEYLSRPTALASWWNNSTILGGRDIKNPQQSGTWLGINRYGRFAAITNYRDPDHSSEVKTVFDDNKSLGLNESKTPLSRGILINKILESQETPLDEIMRVEVEARAENYGGYNIITMDLANQGKNKNTNDSNDENDCHTFYFANRRDIRLQTLKSGEIYGLSNSVLDDPWPKVEMGKCEFQKILDNKTLSESDMTVPFKPKSTIPEILENIRLTIHVPECQLHGTYATRTNTIVLVDYSNRVVFVERTVFDEARASNNYCYSHISADRFNTTSDTDTSIDDFIVAITNEVNNDKVKESDDTQQQQSFFKSDDHKDRVFQFKIQKRD
ncbi:10999_t:CDS:2 [Ambispora gerdemannii]|uniref:10999_t:CDS:1 n=1 Tax=Ambispora gerdemannii TaxID=144530 RepID=A0A9N8VDI5_9GLOM|nr:10999_t:CDS:2 [Ambispora gerdemannii]